VSISSHSVPLHRFSGLLCQDPPRYVFNGSFTHAAPVHRFSDPKYVTPPAGFSSVIGGEGSCAVLVGWYCHLVLAHWNPHGWPIYPLTTWIIPL
jgi:hypothetical protein